MASSKKTARATSYVTERFQESVNGALVEIGEKFGLYTALAAIGPSTVGQVAEWTKIGREPIGHWMKEQAAAGYLDYDRSTGHFSLWCELPRN
jgi:hypothetical protein